MERIGKKTMGRRKIEMKKIEKKSSLQVTFTKRRMGLFRKASELSVLCGAELAILVQSPADKIFSYGHPSVEALVHRFQTGGGGGGAAALSIVPYRDDGRTKYENAVRELEIEKRMKLESVMRTDQLWWDEPFEGMELHELQEYVEAMVALKDNVSHRVEEMEKLKSIPNSAATSDLGQNFQISYQDFDGRFKSEVLNMEAGEDDTNKEQMERDIIGSCSSSNYLIANGTDEDDVLNYDELFDFTEDPTLLLDF